MKLLEVSDLRVSYGEAEVLKGVSFFIDEGWLISIVGSNGAGKTTIMKALTGLVKPTSGSAKFRGREILGLGPHQITEAGISMVPEGRRLFPKLTVTENLIMGAYNKRAWPLWKQTIEDVYDLFPILRERKEQTAKTLSGGEAQMLAIGRALMAKPELLLFDEPSLGLAPKIVEVIFETIEGLKKRGVTLLLVEQHIGHALRLADWAYVIENGKIVADGEGRQLEENDYVKQHYLAV
jgi:branched-chain amino acid transport system ATP-binding protein